MKSVQTLPDSYREIFKMNLQSDKKIALKINIGATAAMVILMIIGGFIVPIRTFFKMEPFSDYLIRLGVLTLAYLLYMMAHELTHAVVMKAAGAKKVVFGFTGMYAFAGSHDDYFDKISYRCIALAPLIVWGIVFGVLAVIVPASWFWIVWFCLPGISRERLVMYM